MSIRSGSKSRAALAAASAAAIVGLVGLTRDVCAQTWSGGSATSNSWSVGANWVGGVAPASSASTQVIFEPSPRSSSTQDVTNLFQLTFLRFAPGLGSFSLSGQSLLFPNSAIGEFSIEQADSNSATIANPIVFGRPFNVGVTGSGSLTMAGTLSGSGSQLMTKTGPGLLRFTNGNMNNLVSRMSVNQGTFAIDGGVFRVSDDGADRSLTVGTSIGAARLDVISGGQMNFAGGSGSGATIDGAAGTTASVDHASWGIAGLGPPALLNVGTTMTGRFDVVSGQVNVSSMITIGNASGSAGTVTIGASSSLVTQQIVLGKLAGSSGTLSFTGTDCIASASSEIDLGGFLNTNGGTATVSVTNGAFLSTGSVTFFNPASTLTVSNAALNVGAMTNRSGTPVVSLTNPATGKAMRIGANLGSSSFSGQIVDAPAGPGGLQVFGGGTFNLANANNTFSGGVEVKSGWLRAGSDGALGAMSGPILLDGGTLMFNSTFGIGAQRAVTLAGNATSTFDTNGFSASLNQPITGAGTLSKQGGGTLTLASGNTYVGGTNVGAGTLTFLAASALIGPVTNAASVVINESSTSTFSGSISGTGSLYKKGFGTAVLAGPLSYSGGTIVEGGTLAFGASQSLPSLTILGGAAAKLTPGGNRLLKVATTDFRTGFIVDLTDNDMMITGASSLLLRTWIGNARNGGAWDAAGVQSSTAAADASHTTGIGYLTGTEYKSMNGATATFDGSPVANSDGLAKFTWNGDANLDGRVTFDDYVRIDTGFAAHRTSWSNGDFNYSGSVTFDDYVLIDIAFNAQNGTLGRAVDWISWDDRSADGSGRIATGVEIVVAHLESLGPEYGRAFLAAIPEPSAVLIVGVQALACTVRPRRRRSRFNPNAGRVR